MIIVNDKIQQHYSYDCVAPIGKEFDIDFKPELSPKEMLKLGVFEGKYLTDCISEFPTDWFTEAKLSFDKPDLTCNFFKVKSRLSLQIWQENGWIYPPDPRGWFQWYCRYYMGRRIPEIDQIQIKRWRSFKRHKIQIEKNCFPMNFQCRAKQRQALLQWAYNPFF